MDEKILEQLTRLSREERDILNGKSICLDDYTQDDRFIVNSKKMLSERQLDLRLHTRFIDFPEHGHDYLEIMYVYSGSITHIIGKETVTLTRGDILFLNRHCKHSILRAEQEDIGVNFILSNEFLQVIYHNIRNNTVIHDFLAHNFQTSGAGEYLLFHTKDNFPIRNLLDNLIYALVVRDCQDETLLLQLVSLLFSYLAHYRETLVNSFCVTAYESQIKQETRDYLERHYPTATLSELSKRLNYNEAYLSRLIKSLFGTSFRNLLLKQRLDTAERLLTTTKMSVEQIIRTVGYENQSHFHRIFLRTYGTTPRQYRTRHKHNP